MLLELNFVFGCPVVALHKKSNQVSCHTGEKVAELLGFLEDVTEMLLEDLVLLGLLARLLDEVGESHSFHDGLVPTGKVVIVSTYCVFQYTGRLVHALDHLLGNLLGGRVFDTFVKVEDKHGLLDIELVEVIVQWEHKGDSESVLLRGEPFGKEFREDVFLFHIVCLSMGYGYKVSYFFLICKHFFEKVAELDGVDFVDEDFTSRALAPVSVHKAVIPESAREVDGLALCDVRNLVLAGLPSGAVVPSAVNDDRAIGGLVAVFRADGETSYRGVTNLVDVHITDSALQFNFVDTFHNVACLLFTVTYIKDRTKLDYFLKKVGGPLQFLARTTGYTHTMDTSLEDFSFVLVATGRGLDDYFDITAFLAIAYQNACRRLVDDLKGIGFRIDGKTAPSATIVGHTIAVLSDVVDDAHLAVVVGFALHTDDADFVTEFCHITS